MSYEKKQAGSPELKEAASDKSAIVSGNILGRARRV